MYFMYELENGESILAPAHLTYFREAMKDGQVIIVVNGISHYLADKYRMKDIKYDLMKLSSQAAPVQNIR